MEPKKKQTRKSVPRPNSGRRAVDGATDLVKVGIRLTPAQHEWVKANGNDGLRRLIQERIDPVYTLAQARTFCANNRASEFADKLSFVTSSKE